MRDEFFTQSICDRCGGSLSRSRTMSRFDTSCLCFTCAEAERHHPDYQRAVEAEMTALQCGDRNFKGIGYPGKKGGKR